jgi:SAM-dependent methyltransferase
MLTKKASNMYKLYQFDFLVLQKLFNDLIQAIKIYLGNRQDLRIVDVGCGKKPYQYLFKNKYNEYIGIDINKSDSVDVVATAENIPFGDDQFDVVLATQSLEHTKDYQSAINEAYRVLKKGGIGFFSVPGVWEIHGAPHDYWRFTEYGLREAFKKIKQIEIVNNGGAILCFFQILNIYLKKIKRLPIIGLIVNIIIIINNLLGWYLDKVTKKYDFFVINYLIIVKK